MKKEIVNTFVNGMFTKWASKQFHELLAEPVRNGIYKKKEFHGNGTKMINMGELFAYDFISNQEMKRVELTSEELEKYCVLEGDLLFARRSLVLEGSGKCSIVVNPSEKTAFESSIIRARLNKEIAEPKFYYYLFKSPLGRGLMASIATRTAVSGIRGSDLVLLDVPFPPVPTQQKIAAVLSAYDGLIENNTRRIQILEEMAQTIYRQWFVKFRFPGYDGIKLVDSGTELGEIPEGWAVKNLGDICNLVMGQSPKSIYYNKDGEGLPFHQGVRDFGSRFPNDRVFCTLENRIAEPGDVLFSVRAPVGRMNVADKKIVIGRGLSAIRHKKGDQMFIYHQLKERFFQEDMMGGGTIFKSVTKADMLEIQFVAPRNNIEERFERTVAPLSDQIQNLTRTNTNLRATRDHLLPKLVSGEVEVDNLEL